MPDLTPATLAAIRARAEAAVIYTSGEHIVANDGVLEAAERHYSSDVPALLNEVGRLALDKEELRVEVEHLQRDIAALTGGQEACYAGTCDHRFCATVRLNAKHEERQLRALIDQAREQLGGGVCDEFETCQHKACDVNWSVYGLLQFATPAPPSGAGEENEDHGHD